MFLILTTKPGQFHTELTPDLIPVETHDYRMCGQHRARFVIAETGDGGKITVIDDASGTVNQVPRKFFPRFETIEAARAELRTLVSFGSIDATLERVA